MVPVCRFALVGALMAVLAAPAGCALQVEMTNATPVVTWIAAPPAVDGVVDITVWVYDLEREPVDLIVTWTLDGQDQGAIAHAGGGHGTTGLTTDGTQLDDTGRPESDGQPHLIRWAVPDDVAATASLQLTFTADDRVAPVADTVVSPAFTWADGLPNVSRLAAP